MPSCGRFPARQASVRPPPALRATGLLGRRPEALPTCGFEHLLHRHAVDVAASNRASASAGGTSPLRMPCHFASRTRRETGCARRHVRPSRLSPYRDAQRRRRPPPRSERLPGRAGGVSADYASDTTFAARIPQPPASVSRNSTPASTVAFAPSASTTSGAASWSLASG